jgi:hypothetical protein
MKRLLLGLVLCCFCALNIHAQKHNSAEARKVGFFVQPGVDLNYPLHDDMIRSHRLGVGVSFLAAYQVSPKYSTGLRLRYAYHLERQDYPEDYAGTEISKLPFSVLTFQWNNQVPVFRSWLAGIDLGYGIADTKGAPKVGLGWVQEYDGCARNYVATSFYLGKRVIAMDKYDILLSMFFDNLFGEKHAENFGGIRMEIRL